MIFIASDHGGFNLKSKILELLKENGYAASDIGPTHLVPDDDYPDYTLPCIKKVMENNKNMGILICKNGVGVSMLANKFHGIRATLSWTPNHAASSRNDDNTNVLALPASYISQDSAWETVKAWLLTPFSNEERHLRRLNKISQHEKESFK